MELIKSVNLGIRFLLEICILIICGYWGFQTGANTPMRILLGIGTPVLFAIIWGTLLAPKSAMRLNEPWLTILEVAIFALATWALFSTGRVSMAIAFGSLYILNKILMLIWRQ